MKRVLLAAFGTAVVGLSWVTQAAADVVIFETTKNVAGRSLTSTGVTFHDPGIYDFEIIAEREFGTEFQLPGAYSYTYWIAGPAGPVGDPLYRRQDDGDLAADVMKTTAHFKYSAVLPQPVSVFTTEPPYTTGTIAPPGTLFYRQFKWESVTGLMDVYNLTDDPLEYTVRVTKRDLPAPVPEPATWAMMILGFGATGAVVRRRRVAVAA